MEINFKCKNCTVCLGKACVNQLPGMGGVDDNKNLHTVYMGGFAGVSTSTSS